MDNAKINTSTTIVFERETFKIFINRRTAKIKNKNKII
jgi:hypothetical protein